MRTDYSLSLIRAEKGLKGVYEGCLRREYGEAGERLVEVMRSLLEVQEWLNGQTKGEDD